MSTEETVFIVGPEATLEGRLVPGSEAGGVVITHPHPLFGGSMANNVVWTAARAFGARGWATLRFNFRGVGRSTGVYGGGLEEVADVAAALAFLRSRAPEPHLLVGYSFGAFVAARALLQGIECDGAVLIAPPVAFLEMAWLPQVPHLKFIVAGDRDDIGPLLDIQKIMEKAEPPVDIVVVKGADHFYGGKEEELFRILRDYPL
jgi:alpha/beta superfamily hydrolase